MGVPGTFTRSKTVPTKLDAVKLSLIWTQWTWKPSPRSIAFDADENGQSRQAHPKILIHLYANEVRLHRKFFAFETNFVRHMAKYGPVLYFVGEFRKKYGECDLFSRNSETKYFP